jgi:hypothetical protein
MIVNYERLAITKDGDYVHVTDDTFGISLPAEWASTLDRSTIIGMFWDAKSEARRREERAKLSWWQRLVTR